MSTFNVDDLCSILHIIYISNSLGAQYGKDAQRITRPPHEVSSAGPTTSTSAATSEISNASSSSSSRFDRQILEPLTSRLKKMEHDLDGITEGFSKVSHVTMDVSILFETLQHQANMLHSVRNTTFPADQLNASVDKMAGVVSKLKSKIPRVEHLRVKCASELINYLLTLSAYRESGVRKAFQDFEKNYKSLDQTSRQCLFCFSAFPAGYVVDKTLLMYWWIGEGLIDTDLKGDGDEIVKQFLEFQFVEPITKNGKFIGLRMHPVIRYAVAYLAERANFFDFDFEWKPTADFRLCQRACLMATADGSSEQQLLEARRLHPEKLRTLFNINGTSFDFDIQGKWLQKSRNVNVLFLGGIGEGIQKSNDLRPLIHLKWLRGMKHLRFLGLGPWFWDPSFIGKLENLRIFTFFPVGALPKSINSMRRLTHLEVKDPFYNPFSGCNMPKKIRELTELRVLKGFQPPVSPQEAKLFATLDDLKGLTKLRKLGIFTTDFLTADHLDALSRITSLRKLEIRWRSLCPPREEDEWRSVSFPTLQKLSLFLIPYVTAPTWLTPSSLESLEKLYIRGGRLSQLGGKDKWKVKILRLRNLPEFEMDWGTDQFPDLIYLETHQCPRLKTEFPCDDNGVWLNKEKLTENLSQELGFRWSFLATYPKHEKTRMTFE